MAIQFHLNGKPQTVEVNPDMPLLWVLRDTMGLIGTKFGCRMALCGACTVHIDGEAMRSTPFLQPQGSAFAVCRSAPTTWHNPIGVRSLWASQHKVTAAN